MIHRLIAAWHIIAGRQFLLVTRKGGQWRVVNSFTPDEGVSLSGKAIYLK